MAMTKRRQLGDEERAKRRRQEQELTERAVAQLRSSDGWQRWLIIRGRLGLRRYSVRNQMLIALQDPAATHVAGFRAWLGLGYAVRRGERSHVRVWAPCPPSKRKVQAWRDAGADPRERPRTYFRLEAVFTQAQIEPLPPPVQPAPLAPPIAEVQGDSLAWAKEPLERIASDLGYRVVYRPLEAGHGGSCDPRAKVLRISSGQSVNAQVDVTCHELAHALVRHDRQDGDPQLEYAAEELVAESVAHLAVSFLGLDTSAAAVPYLATWAESAPMDTFEQIAGLVDRLARRLEQALGADTTSAHDDEAAETATACEQRDDVSTQLSAMSSARA
jgi:antirestriction protein ArdC